MTDKRDEESGRRQRCITLRPINPGDEGFLLRVYSSTRLDELSLVEWEEGQKEAFLKMQFDAQHEYYQTHYVGADFQVILLNDEPIGRLYVARWKNEIRLMDISLLPEYRRAGIGSALLGQLFEEARAAGKPVRIHVEKFNPALRLYERLGFSPIADRGVYLFLEWRPEA